MFCFFRFFNIKASFFLLLLQNFIKSKFKKQSIRKPDTKKEKNIKNKFYLILRKGKQKKKHKNLSALDPIMYNFTLFLHF